METQKKTGENRTPRVVLNLRPEQAQELLNWLNATHSDLIESDQTTDLIREIAGRLQKTITKQQEKGLW